MQTGMITGSRITFNRHVTERSALWEARRLCHYSLFIHPCELRMRKQQGTLTRSIRLPRRYGVGALLE